MKTIPTPEKKVRVKVIKKIWNFLNNDRAKIFVLYGGAGSGKSYTTAQYIIYRALSDRNCRILITRKTNPSLKTSAYQLIRDLLQEMEIKYRENKSDQIIMLSNGSRILFKSMDDPEKIKSAEFNYIWMEEATEFTIDDYQQLRLRLRRVAPYHRKNQLFLTFNPISVVNWVYKTFFEHQQPIDVRKLKTTYKDNPFLDKDYIKMLEELAEQDETFYKIYTLGDFATPQNLVYNNYVISDEMPEHFDEVIYGLDFGFNNPTALVKIGIHDGVYYIFEELYQTKLTNSDLIEYLKQLNISGPIYADSAEPARIKEILDAGFEIYPANKDVKTGIDFVKRQKLVIHSKATNIIKEIQSYKWKEDRNGNVLDEPVKFMDHTLDSIRYAIYTHYSKPQVGIDIIKF